MRITDKNQNCDATEYVLLWLLGIPIPILLLIFYCEGAPGPRLFGVMPSLVVLTQKPQ